MWWKENLLNYNIMSMIVAIKCQIASILDCFFIDKLVLLACKFIKKRLQYRCFPVKFTKFLRTPFLKNIYKRLLFPNPQWFLYNAHFSPHEYHGCNLRLHKNWTFPLGISSFFLCSTMTKSRWNTWIMVVSGWNSALFKVKKRRFIVKQWTVCHLSGCCVWFGWNLNGEEG